MNFFSTCLFTHTFSLSNVFLFGFPLSFLSLRAPFHLRSAFFINMMGSVNTLLFFTSNCSVEQEATNIHLHARFDTFRKFQRCFQSWAVVHGHIVFKYKTHRFYQIRICRFGEEGYKSTIELQQPCFDSEDYKSKGELRSFEEEEGKFE